MKNTMLVLVTVLLSAMPAWAGSKVSLTGKAPSGYTEAAFYTQKGYYTHGTVRSGKFTVAVARKELKGGSLILNRSNHQFGGTVVLAQKGTKSFLQFAASAEKSIALGTVQVSSKGYLKLKKPLNAKAYDKRSNAITALLGAPLGLNSPSDLSIKGKVRLHEVRGDSDQDGVPDGVDVDSDGDGSVDALTGGSSSENQAPYLIVRENMSHTINQTATGIPSLSVIDDILVSGNSSEFAVGFGFSVRDDISSITGAHVVCDDTDTLCGRTAGLGRVNNGTNPLWRDFHPDGTTYPGLEQASTGPGELFFNTGIDPNVGPSAILPGTTYRVEFTGSGGSIVHSKLVTVSPYLVTVPAINSYTANGTPHTINYSDTTGEPGASMDLPIVLGSDGLLTLTFWRPQRQGLGGADGSDYVDVGHLRYGVVLIGPVGGGGGGIGEQACAGYYSGLSTTLTEHTGVPPTNDFWPMTDSAGDSVPSASNTMTFTVDVKACATRAGYSPGDYMLSIQAAGADLGHGSNRSGQDFTVRIQ